MFFHFKNINLGIVDGRNCFLKYFSSRKYCRIEIGSSACLSKIFSKHDIEQFARICLDYNRIHFDSEFAAKCGFKKEIVHGILVNGLVSALLGTILPGKGSILIKEEIKFLEPVYINQKVTAIVNIINIINKTNRIYYECQFQANILRDNNKEVKCLEGNAKLVKKLIDLID